MNSSRDREVLTFHAYNPKGKQIKKKILFHLCVKLFFIFSNLPQIYCDSFVLNQKEWEKERKKELYWGDDALFSYVLGGVRLLFIFASLSLFFVSFGLAISPTWLILVSSHMRESLSYLSIFPLLSRSLNILQAHSSSQCSSTLTNWLIHSITFSLSFCLPFSPTCKQVGETKLN